MNGRQLPRGGQAKLRPGDTLEFGRSPSHEVYKVKLQHVSLHTEELSGQGFATLVVGKRSGAAVHSGSKDREVVLVAA